MSYVYHKDDGTILAVSKENNLSFSEPTKVTFMPELPSDVDYTFYKINDVGVLSDNIDRWKEFRLSQVSDWFENLMATFKFKCEIGGFWVDNRRSGTKNDKDNITSLIKLNLPITPFKDSDGTIHYLSPDELSKLELEMIKQGLGLYSVKWDIENSVTTSTDVEFLRNMVMPS